jgi:adenylate kinase
MTQTQVVDELDALEPLVSASDWHTCDAFPERWIDLVVVLRRNHTRLSSVRG